MAQPKLKIPAASISPEPPHSPEDVSFVETRRWVLFRQFTWNIHVLSRSPHGNKEAADRQHRYGWDTILT